MVVQKRLQANSVTMHFIVPCDHLPTYCTRAFSTPAIVIKLRPRSFPYISTRASKLRDPIPPNRLATLLYTTDFLLLRIEFRTKGPWPIEAVGLRVIGSRADCYIVASLMRSHCSASQVDGRMHSRRTIDVGARGKCHRANHWNHQK